jgi:hypothetical protein
VILAHRQRRHHVISMTVGSNGSGELVPDNHNLVTTCPIATPRDMVATSNGRINVFATPFMRGRFQRFAEYWK